jgi:hypothetical protein
MKLLSLVLLIAFSVPGCSRFTKTGRMDRAYYKQLKQASVAREKHRKSLIRQQSAKIPEPDSPPPLMQPKFQPVPESEN